MFLSFLLKQFPLTIIHLPLRYYSIVLKKNYIHFSPTIFINNYWTKCSSVLVFPQIVLLIVSKAFVISINHRWQNRLLCMIPICSNLSAFSMICLGEKMCSCTLGFPSLNCFVCLAIYFLPFSNTTSYTFQLHNDDILL